MTPPLPGDRTTLELMLRSTTQVLEYVEQLRQQLNHQARIIDQLDRGNLSGRDLFPKVHDALQQRLAQGGPDHRLIREYLDLSEMPVPSVELDVARAEIERRLGTTEERADDRLRDLTLAREKFDRWRKATECFVQKVNELRGRIIEKLESPQHPDQEGIETDSQPVKPQREAIGRPFPASEEAADLPLSVQPDSEEPQAFQYVTLDQMAALVNRCKRTLERLKKRKRNPLPTADVDGGGGRPDEWVWSRIKPWLETEFRRQLPNRYPHRI